MTACPLDAEQRVRAAILLEAGEPVLTVQGYRRTLADLDELEGRRDLTRDEAAYRERLHEGFHTVEDPATGRSHTFRTNRYLRESCFDPTPRQAQFLEADTEREILFGGALSGGKTWAAVACLLQYVDVEGYQAFAFRRHAQDLTLPNGLIHVAETILEEPIRRGEVKLRQGEFREIVFPNGALVQFKHAAVEEKVEHLAGSEVTTVVWDELSTFATTKPYDFLFQRMRKSRSAIRTPRRVRATCNPGGIGGWHIRDRFVPQEFVDAAPDERFRDGRTWRKSYECPRCHGSGVREHGKPCAACRGTGERSRLFIPARAEDNAKHVDPADLEEMCGDLSPAEYRRKREGDFGLVTEGEHFKPSMIRDYRRRGGHFLAYDAEGRETLHDATRMRFFMCCDTASKTASSNDFSALAVYAFDHTGALFLVQCLRDRIEVPDLVGHIRRLYRAHDCEFVSIEDAASGIGVLQELRRDRTIRTVDYSPHGADKLSRATPAIIKVANGEFFVPAERPTWCQDFLEEMYVFGGEDSAFDDQVDTLAQAVQAVERFAGRRPSGRRDKVQAVGGSIR